MVNLVKCSSYAVSVAAVSRGSCINKLNSHYQIPASFLMDSNSVVFGPVICS